MLPDPQDTIVALATAPGPGGRAIVRLSGPAALAVARSVFVTPAAPVRRGVLAGHLQLPDVAAPLPADLYTWPAPHTYTGQELVELHTLSCPPLVDLLVTCLLQAGARAAQPGEFTLRAFLAGKLDLTRAEAVLGVIEAGNRDQLRQALAQLAGGVTRPLEGLRDDLLNLLADVEASLDFAEEDIQFVGREETLHRLAKALAQVLAVGKQLRQRSVGTRPIRVVLTGVPNAGKSSLFNALVGLPSALTSPEPGTTRDYLVHRLLVDEVPIELVDTPGWQEVEDLIDAQAQRLAREQVLQADLLVLCLEAGAAPTEREQRLRERAGCPIVAVATKCDLRTAPAGLLPTSATTGQGLAALEARLAAEARRLTRPALAPSLSRCAHHVESALAHLQRAHRVVLFEDPAEILALELRGALDQLGELVGAVYTDDLLDRVFSRFCIGK